MKTNGPIDLLQTNGTHVLLEPDWSKVYNVKQKTKHRIRLASKFPFFKVEAYECTSFRIRKVYAYLDSCLDPKYCACCSAVQLAKMFGKDVTPFEKFIVEDDMSNAV